MDPLGTTVIDDGGTPMCSEMAFAAAWETVTTLDACCADCVMSQDVTVWIALAMSDPAPVW
ncbi:hypothetical protein A8L33_07445 [Microbacterium aurantiacum]|nr:hypothetical protein A8L33_07445 [Microbacterium chocolatum]